MAFTVVLDTCVLYPAHLRDTLLRLAERPKGAEFLMAERPPRGWEQLATITPP